MSRNPRKFCQPVRLIVFIEAPIVNAIDAYMDAGAGGNHGHCNHLEFARRAIEREIRRCTPDEL